MSSQRYHRGSWRYLPNDRASFHNKNQERATTPPPRLGPLIRIVECGDLAADAEELKEHALISDLALVGSYNWLNRNKPTIVIPGKPPLWTPLAVATEIPDDHGNIGWKKSFKNARKVFRDRNAFRFPTSPLEPAIRASLHINPSLIAEHKFDVVGCSSTMGNLLRLVRDVGNPFRILVETVGDTVFLIRRENSPTELIRGLQGYGKSFPEHYTTWEADVKGSESHQRVVRYRFGGLQFLIRFEADGYIADNVGGKNNLKRGTGPESEDDDIAASMQAMGVSPMEHVPSKGELVIESAGELVDSGHIFNLKTRSAKKQFNDVLESELPRHWVSQIPKLVLAFHDKGTFNDIQIMDLGEKVKDWEKENKKTLAKLAALISRIRYEAMRQKDGKIEICYNEGGCFEVREQLDDAPSALSPPLKELWAADEKSLDKYGESDDDKISDGCSGDWDFDEQDFTACSEDCGYCGRCTY